MRCWLRLIAIGLFGMGCQNRQQDMDQWVQEALGSPREQTRVAAVLAHADRKSAPVANALRAVDQAIEVCQTNLANAQTTAYKGVRAVSDVEGRQVLQTDFTQGSLENTARQLDLGISGDGFFEVKISDSRGDGFGYTRNGNFFVNATGDLVLGAGDGYRIDPPIALPRDTTEIAVSPDGEVEVAVAGGGKKKIGEIKLSRFLNPHGLNCLGGSLYCESERSGTPIVCRPGDDGAGQILQGFLEASNVDLDRERIRVRVLNNWREALISAIDRKW